MSTDLRSRVVACLLDHRVLTLATHGAGGTWAAALFYASDGLDLYFLSSPASRHGVNIAANPRIAATIQRDYRDWREIKGIQLEGKAIVLDGNEAARAQRLYGDRFPVVGRLAQAPEAIVKALAKVSWYKVVAERLCLIDNTIAFGHREELAAAS